MAAHLHSIPISRRAFVQGAGLTGLGLLPGCGRLPGQAQAPHLRVYHIGVLAGGSSNPGVEDAWRQRLRDLGYVEGHNLVIEYRYTEDQPERLPEFAAELALRGVDLIVATTTAAAIAATQATGSIPIVSPNMADPVGIGLVASLAHPGGNVTGLSQIFASLGGKRLELLKATAPWISRVVVLRGPGGQGAARSVQQTQEAGRPLGLEVRGLEVKGPSELGSAFESLAEWGAEAVITVPNFWTPSQKGAVGQFVAQHHLPSMHEQPEYVDGGGLLAYGPSVPDMWRRAADYVDKILRGTSPADLPVEQPTRFNFIINLKTAQALGLTIPQQVLLQATEIIQ